MNVPSRLARRAAPFSRLASARMLSPSYVHFQSARETCNQSLLARSTMQYRPLSAHQQPPQYSSPSSIISRSSSKASTVPSPIPRHSLPLSQQMLPRTWPERARTAAPPSTQHQAQQARTKQTTNSSPVASAAARAQAPQARRQRRLAALSRARASPNRCDEVRQQRQQPMCCYRCDRLLGALYWLLMLAGGWVLTRIERELTGGRGLFAVIKSSIWPEDVEEG